MIPRSKYLADIVTWSRALMALCLIWLGVAKGVDALPVAVLLTIANWTADSIDGPLARRNPSPHQSWIGKKDLQIDMLFSSSLLVYMTGSGIVAWQITLIYVIFWAILFWLIGLPHVLGVLFQAPIQVGFLVFAVWQIPQVVLWVVGWLLIAIAVTWPKFPKVIVPEFIDSVKQLFGERLQRDK